MFALHTYKFALQEEVEVLRSWLSTPSISEYAPSRATSPWSLLYLQLLLKAISILLDILGVGRRGGSIVVEGRNSTRYCFIGTMCSLIQRWTLWKAVSVPGCGMHVLSDFIHSIYASCVRNGSKNRDVLIHQCSTDRAVIFEMLCPGFSSSFLPPSYISLTNHLLVIIMQLLYKPYFKKEVNTAPNLFLLPQSLALVSTFLLLIDWAGKILSIPDIGHL